MDFEYIYCVVGFEKDCPSIMYEKGKWLINREDDGGEYAEIPTPPQEVIDYFNKVTKI